MELILETCPVAEGSGEQMELLLSESLLIEVYLADEGVMEDPGEAREWLLEESLLEMCPTMEGPGEAMLFFLGEVLSVWRVVVDSTGEVKDSLLERCLASESSTFLQGSINVNFTKIIILD